MNIVDWRALDEAARRELLQRPAQQRSDERAATVAAIIERVRCEGDGALRILSAQFDGCALDELSVPAGDFDAAEDVLSNELKDAIADARGRIEAFHRATVPRAIRVETAPGVICERVPRAIGRVGLYVPAGSAPLPSTALMLGVPAQLAGCRQVILCTPPRPDGSVDPAVLYAARLCGIDRVFRLGGAQAIAAMALGTDSVPRCDKLFGPGNAWVTEAKLQVMAVSGGPAIDMPAGPSEVLVIADESADPVFVAADLLSQAEHGPDSQVLLVTDSRDLASVVVPEIEQQLRLLSRQNIARQALACSRIICVESLQEAVEVSNAYAPEHLILNVERPRDLLDDVENAGSVFLGAWSPESVGALAIALSPWPPRKGSMRTLVPSACDYTLWRCPHERA